MGALEIDKARKVFGDTVAVDEVSLDIEDGEFVVIVGPSGCGKTTLLRMVAGLERMTSGELRLDGEPISQLAASRRDIAMVFQSYALYPHMTVARNIGYPLKQQGVGKDDIRQRVQQVAASLEIAELLDRKPGQLSGGQRQRVALGRAIVREPRAFLMDEPLSNLDAKLRAETRAEISDLQRRLGATTLYVTHDQVEALTMGDRIAIMHDGRLQQFGPPLELYARPANVFVAGFLGTPPMNLMRGRLARSSNGPRFVLDGGGTELALPSTSPIPQALEATATTGDAGRCWLGVRPSAPDVISEGAMHDAEAHCLTLSGRPVRSELHGDVAYATLDLGGHQFTVTLDQMHVPDQLNVAIRPEDICCFDEAGNAVSTGTT